MIGLGALFGGILEVSGGAQCCGTDDDSELWRKKAGVALGITGLICAVNIGLFA